MGGFIGLDSGTEHFLSIRSPIYNYSYSPWKTAWSLEIQFLCLLLATILQQSEDYCLITKIYSIYRV